MFVLNKAAALSDDRYAPTASLIRRLNEGTTFTDDCWIWTRSANGKGYGGIAKTIRRGKTVMLRAHRVAYVNEHGPVDPAILIDHECRNKRCVRPSHLRVVTNKQNQEHRGGANENSASGIRGVSWHRQHNRWQAMIRHNRKLRHLGYFDSVEDAAAAVEFARQTTFTHDKHAA